MELKIKLLKWYTGIPVAMLNEKTAELMGVKTKDRIVIKTLSRNSKEMSTIVDISANLVKKNEIGISSELREQLSLKPGQKVDVDLSPLPKSMILIKNKMNNEA